MTIQNVISIAALRATAGASGLVVYVEGYTTPGDGGGGSFYYASNDTSGVDNGATIIVGTGGSRFHRIWDQGQFNVLWAGADGSGTNPSDTAFLNAAAVSNTIYIPTGRYRLNNTFAKSIGPGNASFKIFGDSMESSILYFPTNKGIYISYNTGAGSNSIAHVRDLSITAGQAGGGSGLVLAFPSSNAIGGGFSDVTNVKIRGDDGVAFLYWADGLYVSGVSSLNITGLVVTSAQNYSSAGIGISLVGNSVGSIVYNVNSCILDFLRIGIVYGNYIQGVTVSNTNFTNCGYGILIDANETGLDQLTVVGCQMQTINSNIIASSPIGNIQISANLLSFESPSSTGYLVQGNFSNFSAIGNTFAGSSTTSSQGGISIPSGASGVITGNVFIIMTFGIYLQSGTSSYNVQSNLYNNVTYPVSNAGTGNLIGGGSQ